jgi:hydroxymethylpyrimidine/phosphomethylpyrimidine kinase
VSLLLVGGLDPTGGAGLLRDWWTVRSLSRADGFTNTLRLADVRCILTAWTVQGRGRPAQVFARRPGGLVTALERAADTARVQAIKIGVVPETCVDPLLTWLRSLPPEISVVLDPVLRASDGGALGAAPRTLLRLCEQASLVTPNRAEARALFGPIEFGAETVQSWLGDPSKSGRPHAVLLKHVRDDPERVVDELVTRAGVTRFARPRTASADPRGTGCALASAIASAIARGNSLVDAVASGISWLDRARAHLHLGADGRAHLPANFSDGEFAGA